MRRSTSSWLSALKKTKKTVEEIKAGTDVAALRRNEGIRKAADWVIDHSTIEEKVESK